MKIAKECRRILPSGAKCRALAVKGTPYCFFHQAVRDFHHENNGRSGSIIVPMLEDRASIQLALMSTLNSIASGRMDAIRGRAYLYGLQLAMHNLGKNGQPFASGESVSNPVCPNDEEFLAPDEDEPSDQPDQPDSECPTACPEPEEESTASADLGINESQQTTNMRCAVQAPPAQESDPPSSPSTDRNETFTISASGEESPCSESAPPLLARYGPCYVWECKEPELTEKEIHKRKYYDKLIRTTLGAIFLAAPCLTLSERRRKSAQFRAEFIAENFGRKPEPRACIIATRYLAGVFA